MFAYYNINSLRNKFIDLKEIMSRCLPDVLVVAETKLDESFPNAQFEMDYYYEPRRRDKSKFSGGLIEYIRKGIIHKSKPCLELKSFDSIASEITINKIKWLLFSFYRPPINTNLDLFFTELSNTLNVINKTYENIILMGDINIDTRNENTMGSKRFSNFMDVFNLKNLIKEETCFSNLHKSSIDVILTNKPRRFYKSGAYEFGLSDCHKLISTCLRSFVARLKQKIIKYRSYKKFDESYFLADLKQNMDRENINIHESANTLYENFTNIIYTTLNIHAPIKSKTLRGNHFSFYDKAFKQSYHGKICS